jgi:hypothetical protein
VEWELMENPEKWEGLPAVGLYKKY